MKTLQVRRQEKIWQLNYKVKRPLPIGKNKKVIGLMKIELGRKIMKEIVVLRPKVYSCLTDDGCVDKKANSQRSMQSNRK